MPPRSGLKRKRIEAGEPLFILEGKSPEPADNSAAGSFLKWVLSVLDPLTAGHLMLGSAELAASEKALFGRYPARCFSSAYQ